MVEMYHFSIEDVLISRAHPSRICKCCPCSSSTTQHLPHHFMGIKGAGNDIGKKKR
jgi:hypothetical protein